MRTYRVLLNDKLVGSIVETADGSLFVHDEAYSKLAPPQPVLSQSFLGATGSPRDSELHNGLVPFFANLLPEKGPLRRYLASLHEVDADDDFALLRVLGRNLPGAVVVTPLPDSDEDDALADAATDRRARWRFSLGGVQMKFSATRSGDRWSVAPLHVEGNWIVKLASADFPGIVENEFAIMSLARDCGLDVPDIEIIDVRNIDELDERFLRHGSHAYGIRRFDRTEIGRIHQEDFCQVLGRIPQNKYGEDDPRNTAERVLDVVRVLCPPEDVREWIRRLAFTIAVGNGDSHLKNHALHYPNGSDARLSPLYDVLCTLCYDRFDDLALPIAGNYRFTKIDPDLLDRFANLAGVSPRIVKTEFREMTGRLHEVWPRAASHFEDAATRSIVENGIHHRMSTLVKSYT